MNQDVLAVPLGEAGMRHHMRQLLRRRLLWAALAWLALIVLGGWWVAHDRLQGWRQQVAASGAARLNALQDNVENHFRSLAALGQVLTRQPGFIEFLHHDVARQAASEAGLRHPTLRDKLLARPDVRAMDRQLGGIVRDFEIRQAYLTDALGTAVADSAAPDADSATLGDNLRARPGFQDAMARGTGFQFAMGRLSRKPGFHFSARISDGGRPLGTLTLMTDPTSMARLFADATGRIVQIVDANGIIVASNRADQTLRQMPRGPSFEGREQDARLAYLDVPKPLDAQATSVTLAGQAAPALELDGRLYLMQSRALAAYPYTVSVLTPLASENAIRRSTLLAALFLLALGWLVLWSGLRRLERQEAVEQARKEALDMTRALPLTLFRYRLPAEGPGWFSYIGPGVRDLFGKDEAEVRAHPEALWPAASLTEPGQDADDGTHRPRPPIAPTEFAIEQQGRQRWICAASAVARKPDGGRIYDGYWLDVTARREAEWRFEAAFCHAPSAFFFVHRDKGIVRCNEATLKLFGATDASQLEGRSPWREGLSPATQPQGQASPELADRLIHQNPPRDHKPLRFEWRHQRLDGSLFDAEVALIWLSHEDRDLYFAIVEDVTARKQTEEALRAASEAAQETTRAKSAFLANMSHEMRTPLNAIIGMTHLALEDGPAERLRGYVSKAHQAATNLLGIINDVLDMSKIEAGHLELECIEFALQDVLNDVSTVLGLPAERKGLELLFTAPPDLPDYLTGDPMRLRQILVNLGSNAIKFTDKGSVTLGMDVQHQHGNEIVLHGWVQDTGIGMSQEQTSRLFRPFSQVDASITRRHGGTGLGLTISRQLAERMGGQLWVDSEIGQGSTFHFIVRMGLAERSGPMAVRSDTWRGKRVLLADDSPDARQILGRMLESLGLQVDFADDGEQALALVERPGQAYDWILLDWKMPRLDGVTCARRIHDLARSRFPRSESCILLVTAFNRQDALRSAVDVPFADVLAKPVTPSTLFESLGRALTQALDTPHAPERPAAEPVKRLVKDTPLQGVHILLAEDQPLNQELACELLERAGAEVVVASDGREALAALEASREPFDCVLMDCQMPGMDGYTASRRIRADVRWQRLPVIAMTASALVSDREEALSAGMNDHISKPLDVNRMYQVILRWVDVARGTKAAA